MKILHTGDWHLGKIVNEYSMLEEQKYIFQELYKIIEREQPDAIIVAGDIYDRSIPPKEAVELLDHILRKISLEDGIPLLMISGNHDSQERLDFGKDLFERSHVYIEGAFQPNIRQVTLEDEYGPVHFYLVPYIHPTLARYIYKDEEIRDHQDVMDRIISTIPLNTDERNVLINHNFFAGNVEEAYTSDSERSLSIGGTEIIDVERVKQFDYVALGHLHRPQKVKYDHVRYSGSLLKYSISEINTSKGVYIVELKEKGDLSIAFHSLKPRHDFIKIEGSLSELTSKSYYSNIDREAYIYAVITDEKDLYDPIGQLRAVYPNILQIDRPNFLLETHQGHRQEAIKTKAPFQLFQDFYLEMTGQELDESYETIIQQLMEKVKEGDAE